MMDRLLEWMSFRRTGQIKDIPDGLADAGKMSHVVYGLAMLGHLELLSSTRWKITPPVLAVQPRGPDDQVSAVLCGARTPGVLGSLDSACTGTGLQFMTEAASTQPAVVRISGASISKLVAVASDAGIPLQPDASLTILACTPSISAWPRTPCPMVGGRVQTVRRFSCSRLGWVEATLDEASRARFGLFKIKRDWDWVNLLKTDVSECADIDSRAGRLVVARKRKVASWTADSGILSLPGKLFPPSPIARALALCTGFLPKYDAATRRISFTGVSPEVQRLTLTITGLRLA